jgi:hypothetical protein
VKIAVQSIDFAPCAVARPLIGHLALYAGQRPHERVLVLLALLGGQQQVELAKDSVEVVR